jgi:acyl-CoA synthetase (AMP-forming)/AMP-acid ligase II
MLGLMQDWPLLCHHILEHAPATIHSNQEVVTQSVEGPIVRSTYKHIHERALKVSQALDIAGIRLGDRVAPIGWNTARHLECWYGIPATRSPRARTCSVISRPNPLFSRERRHGTSDPNRRSRTANR